MYLLPGIKSSQFLLKLKTGSGIILAKSSPIEFKDIIEVTEGRTVPGWMEVDYETKKGTVKELPSRDMIDVPVNETLIVELYSK